MFKQTLIPGFPDGAQRIGKSLLSIVEAQDRVSYLVGADVYFSHKIGDSNSRRFILSSLLISGHVRASELEAAPLCIAHRTLMNWLAQNRTHGPDSFFHPANPKKPRVMSHDKVNQCVALLASGQSVAQTARTADIEESTLRKAIKRGAVTMPTVLMPSLAQAASTKSERSREDANVATGIGTACTRCDERVEAALGLGTCAVARFELGQDVEMGGLLTGLPALCANGLLSGLDKHLHLPKGFYSCLHILLTLAFMALGRIRRPEQLRHIPPGEFGKSLGLDRVPEVRTLRQKIGLLAAGGNTEAWLQDLSKSWMEQDPEEAGYLYIDGHVRVYSGSAANLPRRFVSREKLCLRGTTDYWVNDAIGRPFFVVSKAVTDGLADTLINDIVPDLCASVPQQPSQSELDADPLLHRFVVVFDREGATHSLLSKLWEQRIAGLTYRKNVKDQWPQAEFLEQDVPSPGGGSTRMRLATRQTELKAAKLSMPVTEVRRLTDSGHQTAIITSAQKLGATQIASRMFARWCQENYFAYMMQHYDIDGLIEYGVQEIPGTTKIINPAWRALDAEIRQKRRVQQKHQVVLAQKQIKEKKDIQPKAQALEAIQELEMQLEELRAQRKAAPKKVPIDSLPEELRPTALAPLSKQLCDAVKMIAYRAETALVGLLQRHLQTQDEARALVRRLFISSADIEPDNQANTLTIKVHRTASPAHDKAIAALLQDLSNQEFHHPETGALMRYSLV
jgi:hypothetical protein